MSAGYDNDNDDDGNSHDEDVDSTDFKTTWKIYLILFFNVGAEKWGAEGQLLRAEGNQDPFIPTFWIDTWFILLHVPSKASHRCSKIECIKYFTKFTWKHPQ